MKFNFAIICDNAFLDKQNRLNIVQSFNTINAEEFPAIHQRLTVVTNYIAEAKDLNKKKEQTVAIFDPENHKIIDNTIVTETNTTTGNEVQFISYFLNIPLKTEGTYTVKVYLDQDKKPVKELPLHAVKI